MKRGLSIALVAALAFAIILIARMPAAWIVPQSVVPGPCAGIDGSLWSGSCANLTVGGTALGDLSWDLKPLSLLRGRLAAHVTLAHGAATASGDVELALGQRIIARNVTADAALDPRLSSAVPASVSGQAHAELALIELQRGAIKELQGRIEVRNLEDRSGADTPLGSYLLVFPGGNGEQVGKLRDLDGPLALEGTLRLTAQPGYELEGLIAARRGAPPEIVNNLRFLGSPDATGRRPFSLAGTF